MHIVHVNFARGFRGGERQTLNLMHGLSNLGHKQTLVCRPSSELMRRSFHETNATIITSKHPLLGHRNTPRADIIHVHEARGAYWALLEFALRGIPYIITRRVVNPISSSWLTRKVYAKASVLAGVSADVALRLSAQTIRKVEVILDSCSSLNPSFDEVKRIRENLGGSPIIGHVGVLHDKVKSQSTLIKAFALLTEKLPQARLVLVGSGSDEIALKTFAANDKRIVFAGQQNNVADWLAAMDVFAFPSRVEALGSSVLDAMILSVPVVASSAGGLPEITGANERGLTVSDQDPASWSTAILRLLEDDALQSRLVEAGKKFAEENNVDAHAKRYLSLYEHMLKSTLAST